MSKLMEYVDIVVANEEDAEKVFGIKAADTDVTTGELDLAGYKYVAKELMERFNLEIVTITLRRAYRLQTITGQQCSTMETNIYSQRNMNCI